MVAENHETQTEFTGLYGWLLDGWMDALNLFPVATMFEMDSLALLPKQSFMMLPHQERVRRCCHLTAVAMVNG